MSRFNLVQFIALCSALAVTTSASFLSAHTARHEYKRLCKNLLHVDGGVKRKPYVKIISRLERMVMVLNLKCHVTNRPYPDNIEMYNRTRFGWTQNVIQVVYSSLWYISYSCRYLHLHYTRAQGQAAYKQALKPRNCPDFNNYINTQDEPGMRSISPYGPIPDYDPSRWEFVHLETCSFMRLRTLRGPHVDP